MIILYPDIIIKNGKNNDIFPVVGQLENVHFASVM
jgi:hypothetical protein